MSPQSAWLCDSLSQPALHAGTCSPSTVCRMLWLPQGAQHALTGGGVAAAGANAPQLGCSNSAQDAGAFLSRVGEAVLWLVRGEGRGHSLSLSLQSLQPPGDTIFLAPRMISGSNRPVTAPKRKCST